jgi:hypothetical protein
MRRRVKGKNQMGHEKAQMTQKGERDFQPRMAQISQMRKEVIQFAEDALWA